MIEWRHRRIEELEKVFGIGIITYPRKAEKLHTSLSEFLVKARFVIEAADKIHSDTGKV